MTDRSKMDALVSEIFKFTVDMSETETSEALQEMHEAVLQKMHQKEKLYQEFPQWMFLLERQGLMQETTVLHQMQCTGHYHRWAEVQALGREMYNIRHTLQSPMNANLPTSISSPQGPAQTQVPLSQQAGALPAMPAAPPSPNINSMVNPLLPMPVPGHTPCLVTTMADGEVVITPMAPSPSPIGMMPPLLPMVMPQSPGGLPTTDVFMKSPMQGYNDNDLPELPEFGMQRSKSVPQATNLRINVQQDSIQPPVMWNPPGMVAMPAQRSSRSRSRDRVAQDPDAPLPLGPPIKGSRSTSRERERPYDPELMNVPIIKMGVRSNSMPTFKNKSSSSRRRRRNRQPTKRELAEAKLKELGVTYGPRFTRTGMRGENVLRLKAKTKRALENIVPFIKYLDERIQLEEISCPLSKPAKEHVRGFLAYLRTNTVEEAQQVHDVLFPEYCDQNCTPDGARPFKLIELNPMAKGAKAALENQELGNNQMGSPI